MTEAHTSIIPAALAVSYQIALDKNAQRQMVFQGHLPIDTSMAALNSLADRMAKAADRQMAIYELADTEAELAACVSTLHEMDAQVENTMAVSRERWTQEGRRGEWAEKELSGKERGALEGIASSRLKYEGQIERAQIKIERCKKVIADAVEFGPDRDSGVPSG
jgi:hypothetical protein